MNLQVCARGSSDILYSILAWDVHDAQLSKNDSLAECNKNLCPVLVDHVNLAPLDDVHLPADISFLAHIVTGGINLQKIDSYALTLKSVGIGLWR